MKPIKIALLLSFISSPVFAYTTNINYGYEINSAGKLVPSKTNLIPKGGTTAITSSDYPHIKINRTSPVKIPYKPDGLLPTSAKDLLLVSKAPVQSAIKGIVKGGVQALIVGALADYLISRGLELMEDGKTYMKKPIASSDRLSNGPAVDACNKMYGPPSYRNEAVINNNSGGRIYITCHQFSMPDNRYLGYMSTSMPSSAYPPSPASDSDLANAANGFVETNPADAVKRVGQVEVLDGSKTSLDDAISPSVQTSATEKTLADGTKVSTSTNSQTSVSMKPTDTGAEMKPTINTTETTTTTTTKPDGTTGTDTETTVKPGTGGGSGGTPEPVPPAKNICETNPTAAACAELGTPDDADVPGQTITVSYSPVDVGGTAYCPAPRQITAGGRALTITYQPMCDFASMIKPLLLAIAGIASCVIMFGAARNG